MPGKIFHEINHRNNNCYNYNQEIIIIKNSQNEANMLIALEKLREITNGIVILLKQYPTESARLFPNFLVKESGKIALEKDGSLPKRLTFLGHLERINKKYCGYTAEQFVAHLIEQIEAAAKIDPRIKTSITEIDLLGCNVGFISTQTGKSFAEDVAKRLHQAGYPMAVRATSNRGIKDSETWYNMVLATDRKNAQFNVKAFSTEAERNKYNFFRKQKSEAETPEYKSRLTKKIQEHSISVLPPTSDIRASMDQNPNFNFTIERDAVSAKVTDFRLFHNTSNQRDANPDETLEKAAPQAKKAPR